MTPEMQSSLLRQDVPSLIVCSFFLFIAVTALLIATVRRKEGARILIWIGLWSAMYGCIDLAYNPVVTSMMPQMFEPTRQLFIVCCRYLIIVPGTLTFMELTLGALRHFANSPCHRRNDCVGCNFVVSHFRVAEHFSRLQPVARRSGFGRPDCEFVGAEIVKTILGSFTTLRTHHGRSHLFR